jgi:hypothetical protein
MRYDMLTRLVAVDQHAATDDALTMSLIVTWRTQRPNGDMAVSFRYELVDDGRRLCATEQVRGTAWDQDNVWIFERRLRQ